MRNQHQLSGQPGGSSLWSGKKKAPARARAKTKSLAGELCGSSGKVVLAAIVHQDNCSAWASQLERAHIDHIGEPNELENSRVRQEELQSSHPLGRANTHDDKKQPRTRGSPDTKPERGGGGGARLASKLASRWMFSKKKQAATTLIDRAQSNEYSRKQQQRQPELTSRRRNTLNGDDGDDSSKQKPPSELAESTSLAPTTATSSTATPETGNKVIEFKFDLIVDQNDGEADGEIRPSANQQRQQQQHKKLDSHVSAIVGSFVLDSSDVCLMSMGRNGNNNSGSSDGYAHGDHNQLDYLFRLTSQCLRQTFQLLEEEEASCLVELSATLFLSSSSSPWMHQDGEPPTRNSSAPESFEIVDLLLDRKAANEDGNNDHNQQQRPGVDGLADDFSPTFWQANCAATSAGCHQTSVDCASLEEACAHLQRLQAKVNSALHSVGTNDRRPAGAESEPEPAQKSMMMMMICLKLKRRINGGLFSNRMCLIDFDSKLSQLKPILESTFTGHALAHLKRRKLHLASLQSALANSLNQLERMGQKKMMKSAGSTDVDSRILSSTISTVTGRSQSSRIVSINNSGSGSSSISADDGDDDEGDSSASASATATAALRLIAAKQHHQVASESKLIQAEWLLYKQLSSALIRTLIIVHVHKLSPASTSTWFAAATNKAAANTCGAKINDSTAIQRLQKTMSDFEHRLMADNLSLLEFARSIQRAAAQKLKRRKRHLCHHLAASNVSLASNASETTTTLNDDIHCWLATPIRRPSVASATLAHRHHQQHLIPGRRLAGGSFDRKCSMDDASAGLARHFQRNQHRHRHRLHHQKSEDNFGSDWAHQKPATGAGGGMDRLLRQTIINDLIESSSMSTTGSSGSAGYRTTKSPLGASSSILSHRATTTATTNFSDSDSVASATLNSYSYSSSQHQPQVKSHQQQQQQHLATKRSRNQRDIELKWMAKQQQAAASSFCQLAALNASPSIAAATPTQDQNSVIRIDCDPAARVSDANLSTTTTTATGALNCTDQHADDGMSDTCSHIAEPPGQLKLEKFLSQLGNLQETTQAAGDTNGDNSTPRQLTRSLDPDNPNSAGKEPAKVRQTNESDEIEDEDDDCKSHSSIVDHLSSLAKELNCKLNHRLGQQPNSAGSTEGANEQPANHLEIDLGLFSVTGQREAAGQHLLANKMGYLQQLLNSSTQLRNKTAPVASTPSCRVALKDSLETPLPPPPLEPASFEDQLAALSINCHHQLARQVPPSPSVSSSGAYTTNSSMSQMSGSSAAGSPNTTADQAQSPDRQPELASRQQCDGGSRSLVSGQPSSSSSPHAGCLMRFQQQQNVKTSPC